MATPPVRSAEGAGAARVAPDPEMISADTGPANVITEVRRQETLLKTGALQDAIFYSANFSSIATDANGVIQIFNVGAERMLGYAAADVTNKITPADISDPQELIARASALSVELSTPITPGFEALVFKASRGIEDIYELTYIRKDGSRFPAVVSVTALRDAQNAIIGAHTRRRSQRQCDATRHRNGLGGGILPLPHQTHQGQRVHGHAERGPGIFRKDDQSEHLTQDKCHGRLIGHF